MRLKSINSWVVIDRNIYMMFRPNLKKFRYKILPVKKLKFNNSPVCSCVNKKTYTSFIQKPSNPFAWYRLPWKRKVHYQTCGAQIASRRFTLTYPKPSPPHLRRRRPKTRRNDVHLPAASQSPAYLRSSLSLHVTFENKFQPDINPPGLAYGKKTGTSQPPTNTRNARKQNASQKYRQRWINMEYDYRPEGAFHLRRALVKCRLLAECSMGKTHVFFFCFNVCATTHKQVCAPMHPDWQRARRCFPPYQSRADRCCEFMVADLWYKVFNSPFQFFFFLQVPSFELVQK